LKDELFENNMFKFETEIKQENLRIKGKNSITNCIERMCSNGECSEVAIDLAKKTDQL